MLEHRHAAEWMPRQMRLALSGFWRDYSQSIIGALFFERRKTARP
jgi:hypothetical protein